MSTFFYGCCLDCKQKIFLDKFYDWASTESLTWRNGFNAPMTAKPLQDYCALDDEDFANFDHLWVWKSLKLHWFINKHQGHRVGVWNEHDDFVWDLKEVDYLSDETTAV
jgi:hypothetical protein